MITTEIFARKIFAQTKRKRKKKQSKVNEVKTVERTNSKPVGPLISVLGAYH